MLRPARLSWPRAWTSGAGSTVGPDGALYVTVGATGEVVRIDPRTGAKAVFASGVPPAVVGSRRSV